MPLVHSIRFSTPAFQLGAPRRSSSCSSLFPAKRGSCRTWNGGARNARGNCFGRLRKLCIVSIGSVSSGSDPFTLRSSSETEGPALTVVHALRRMWELIADDRMVVYIAVVSLTVAAISEILIPAILTASVFSAQRGNTVAFYGYGRLLIILCFISGICSGMRSGCFALANVTLVKHLRERLYSTLIFQDISFFDIEPVGGLTSRLGADCQRMSQVLANDLHLILRNVLQGTGALVNLLILSWPLTLSTLLICSILAAIFLVYGRYRKNAAKVSQDLTAVANQIAEDTLSQMRTVRVYGSEKVEIKRYKQWIERLASVGILESVAYGSWSMSFTMLYRLTQVLAVMLGGISLLTGHVSSEQLTKYVLYCEWMIYATWRLVDSLSSLMQSIGASERVFQLMNLSTRDQYLTKEYMQLHEGIKLPNLTGCIEFKDVSFCYPSRTMVPVLQDVNLLVQPGNVVAIVGPSGCGKSSLINLLLRLYEPSHGLLYIDNIPVEKLDVRWLRSKIGYVGQFHPGPLSVSHGYQVKHKLWLLQKYNSERHPASCKRSRCA
ncbi:hypothetical protein SAY86_014435 [Trapa natans]|uniref:ABC transmembrane type-1 domain-containing protein n=1 Tax=Trapa natans TaxID=22666 RepID=A0AAN7KZ64_TRANT|nr:hypothetical protein SAY86_014435 [Trapa natans]